MKKIGLILVAGMLCMGLWSQARATRGITSTQGWPPGRINCNKLKPLKQRLATLEKNLKEMIILKNNLKTAAARSRSIIGLNKLKSTRFFNRKLLVLKMKALRSELLHLAKINKNSRSFNRLLDLRIKELKSIHLALLNKYRRLKFNRLCLNPLMASLKRSSKMLTRLQQTKIKFAPANKRSINLGKVTGPAGASKPVPANKSADLSEDIKKLETEMEETRNKRQQYQTMFENFDQKANQLFNILSTLIKSINEMRMAASRNML